MPNLPEPNWRQDKGLVKLASIMILILQTSLATPEAREENIDRVLKLIDAAYRSGAVFGAEVVLAELTEHAKQRVSDAALSN